MTGWSTAGDVPSEEEKLYPCSLPALECMENVEAQQVNWLWKNRIPAGRLSLFVGEPGIGKSFLTLDMAARISTGTPFPDGADCQKGSTILISAEDDAADTIKPRLLAHHADCTKIHVLTGIISKDKRGKETEDVFTLKDIDILEKSLQQIDNVSLVIIDPVNSYLGGGVDSHKDNSVRSVLAPVAMLAERYGCAFVIVTHRRKSSGTSADSLAMGSLAFSGTARAVWHVSRDPENKNRRLFLPGKNNLAAQQKGLAFTIIPDPARVSWESQPVDLSADDALAIANNQSSPGPTAVDEAVSWLSDVLADGPKLAREVKKEANNDGISLRTLDRAKATLKVVAGPNGFKGPWKWTLPQYANNSTQSTQYASQIDRRTVRNVDESVAHCVLQFNADDVATDEENPFDD